MELKQYIANGNASLGIEFGSTRIKAVLIDEGFAPVAQGDYTWDNKLENGIWTYSNDDILTGLKESYKALKADVLKKYGVKLNKLKSIGISAMMHGYLAFDGNDNLLVPFRTWRNTITEKSSTELSALFGFSIPQRWSAAHLDRAIIENEPHVKQIKSINTLAGYVHYLLCGEKVLGIGDASGMFPIKAELCDYDDEKLKLFDKRHEARNLPFKVREILPKVLPAGKAAGFLTEKGASLLDCDNELMPGALLCPPEGDAGTGMTATNSVLPGTGNVSAGTSVFAMVVLEKPLSKLYPEIDIVSTPDGKDVAMVHCNNCTSEINAWAETYKGLLNQMGIEADTGKIYEAMFKAAMKGEYDAGGVFNYNFLSGEHVLGLEEGRPMTVRLPEAKMNFNNFSRSLVFGAVSALRIGMDILFDEQVKITSLLGHGGFFKTPGTAQNLLAASLKTPVSVMETAGEGGAWGIAILAKYAGDCESMPLPQYLNEKVFKDAKSIKVEPDCNDINGFDQYITMYKKGLKAEKLLTEMKK